MTLRCKPGGTGMTPDQNTYGTGYGCACVHHDARECADLRYGRYYDDVEHSAECGERCECPCHFGWDEEMDEVSL